jgi:outer membrane protein, multidrug efflux system
VSTARRALELADERYRAGLVSYLDVVDANREALQAERAKARLDGERLMATVRLIKSLGGGWSEQQVFARTSQSEKHAK